MDYQIENLGPERFQQLCQSLLIGEFPGVQCLPVAQPDGGRDAFTHGSAGTLEAVFQVKFLRRPDSWNDVVEWLESTIDSEIDKVRNLAERGAKSYYLLTNALGTAHPTTGSVDRLQTQLDRLPIPAQCWWRDDICRRLDRAWDVKWRYPELLTGVDLLRLLVENRLVDSEPQRAIRAFVVDQYEKEREVKFKQVELQNRLLDLFVDVPLAYLDERVGRDVRFERQSLFKALVSQVRRPAGRARAMHSSYPASMRDDAIIGGARLLLSDLTQERLRKVVIEGAPGQGKSTISQFICQVHRIRILNNLDAAILPEWQRSCRLRLPFKIDLRDLAAWLDGLDPFYPEEVTQQPSKVKKSLESFLAAQIRFHSGGTNFSVDNLLSVLAVSPTLLVFDGLDEVGKRQQRQSVIEEITNGVRRLESNCPDLQVVVTSRPAAFSLSPGLPASEYAHFSLAQLSREIIDEYTEKWVKARNLSSSEGKDVKRILKDKLDAPHLRDLARNPMQLAILLSLIHTRGSSLPDKRTALYDSYIELFFNREAEKSRIVRDHRALLIDIHRFLAWELHARSEVGKGRGNIGADELLSLLTAYLKAQEYDESLAGELFDGMIERVVAIVSRVQGTYEFEVQPLREYFAARHLYETAPYSPPGNERLGTKPERFDALAKNFFWLNVTRFYAGCYSVGELSSLVDGLRSLAESGDYNYISHPKTLAATLLSDWVFAQHPRSVKAVLALMLDGSGLPFYVSNLQRRRIEGSMIELPTEAGRRELLARAYSMLKQGDSEKRQTVIGQAIELINQNRGSQELRVEWEKDLSARKSVERARWLDYGVQLGYIGQSTIEQIEELYGNAELGISEVWGLLRSNKSAWLETNSYRFERALRAVVLYPAAVSANNGRNLFERLSLLLDPEAYTYLFAQAPGETAFDCLKYSMPWRGSFEGDASTSRTPTTQEGWVIHDKLVVEFQKPIAQWRSQIDPWSNVVEAIRPICGDHATALALSCIGANIRAPQETCTDAKELIDRTVPLARRVRYARLRAGQSSWWSRQLSSATRNDEIELVLAVLLLWGSPAVLQNLVGQISSSISTLSADAWIRFDETVSDVFESAYRYGSLGGPAALQTIPDADDRTMIALAWRMSPKQRRTFFVERLLGYGGDDMPTLCAQSSLAFGEIYSDTEWATQSLERICVAFQRGVAGRYKWINIGRRLSVTMAREVLKRSDRVPSFLLVHAEESLREAVGRAATPLIHVARANRWFQ